MRSKLTQQDGAEVLEIDRTYLSQMLNGKRTPGLETALRIENITGVSVRSWSAQPSGAGSDVVAPVAANVCSGNE